MRINKMIYEYNVDYYIDFKNKRLLLTKSGKEKATLVWNTKKITGTKLYGLVGGEDKFNSSFEIFLSLIGIKIPIIDKKYVDAGNKYEKIIFNKLKEKYNSKYEMNLIGHIENAENPYDFFPSVEKFGGIPDVLMRNLETGETIVIDIKTTKKTSLEHKQNSRKQSTDEKYNYQVELYRNLLKYDKSMIVYGALEYPNDYLVENEDVEIIELNVEPIDIEEAQIIAIENMEEWIRKGESPEFSLQNNLKTLMILTAEDVDKIIDKLSFLNEGIY